MEKEQTKAEPQKEKRDRPGPKAMDEENLILETSEDLEIFPTFDSMSLREPLVRGTPT